MGKVTQDCEEPNNLSESVAHAIWSLMNNSNVQLYDYHSFLTLATAVTSF